MTGWDDVRGYGTLPVSVTMTITDVDWQVAALMLGCSVLDLLPTPQNRDTRRMATLAKADQ